MPDWQRSGKIFRRKLGWRHPDHPHRRSCRFRPTAAIPRAWNALPDWIVDQDAGLKNGNMAVLMPVIPCGFRHGSRTLIQIHFGWDPSLGNPNKFHGSIQPVLPIGLTLSPHDSLI